MANYVCKSPRDRLLRHFLYTCCLYVYPWPEDALYASRDENNLPGIIWALASPITPAQIRLAYLSRGSARQSSNNCQKRRFMWLQVFFPLPMHVHHLTKSEMMIIFCSSSSLCSHWKKQSNFLAEEIIKGQLVLFRLEYIKVIAH